MHHELVVLVTGQFSVGKSTLINALLGQEILSVSCPVTGVITEIRYGEKIKATFFPTKESGIDHYVVLQNPSMWDVRSNINQNILYDRIVIECNLPLLKEGIVLVDTVGITDSMIINPMDNDYIERYFTKADAIIYLMNATTPYSKEDKELLTMCNQIGLRNLIVAYTRFGEIRKSFRRQPVKEFEKYISVCRNYALKHTDLGPDAVHFIDSVDALDAKLDYDDELLLRSGLPKLEEQLRTLLHNAKRKDSLLEAVQRLNAITKELPKKEMGEIRGELRAAQEKIQNKNFNLAVIGDFSCGKSTFINALFGENVLSTDMQPTTALPTYIYWTEKKGSFRIVAYSLTSKKYDLAKEKERQNFEEYIHRRLPRDSRRWIDALTTDNTLCGYVKKIELFAPQNSRFDSICLIDTPGVNPGSEGTEGHIRVTQNILREAADAAIVMFPADKVFTRSFQKFLESNATHLLQHSIFIVTQCDKVRKKEELQNLRDFVRGQLEILGVTLPIIHCISAQCALDVIQGVETDETSQQWHKSFEQTMDEIFQSLSENRYDIVEQNVCSIISKAITALDERIQATRAAYEVAQATLKEYSPQNLEKECNMIQQKFLNTCTILYEQYKARESEAADRIIRSCKIKAQMDIGMLSSKSKVSSYVDDYYKIAGEKIGAGLKDHCSEMTRRMHESFQEYVNQLNKCFQKYHLQIMATSDWKNLQATEIRTDVENIGLNLTGNMTAGSVVNALGETVEEVLYSDSIWEGGLNIVIGSLWVTINAIGATINLFRSIDSIKADALNNIGQALNGKHSEILKKINEIDCNLFEQYKRNAAAFPEKLKKSFAAEYANFLDGYKLQEQALNQNLTEHREHLKELQVIRELVEE